jgi:hypothetical protein
MGKEKNVNKRHLKMEIVALFSLTPELSSLLIRENKQLPTDHLSFLTERFYNEC